MVGVTLKRAIATLEVKATDEEKRRLDADYRSAGRQGRA
jgi:hypothetical protein